MTQLEEYILDETMKIAEATGELPEVDNITKEGDSYRVTFKPGQKAKKEDRAMKDIDRLKKEVEQLYEITDTATVCKLPGEPGCAFLTLDHNEKVKRAIFDMFKAGDKVKVIIRKED